jgi:type II secretion system protein H
MGARRDSGFTLIELVAVVVLLGIMMAVVVTRMDHLVPEYRLRGAAREVAAALRLGKARAVATGKEVYLEVDLERGRYWLLAAFPKKEAVEKALEEGLELEAKAYAYEPVFEQELADGVEFVDLIFSEKEKATGGRSRIRMSPFGSSSHTIVNLRNRDDRELSVKLNGFTGAVSFYDHRKEAEELLEDEGP